MYVTNVFHGMLLGFAVPYFFALIVMNWQQARLHLSLYVANENCLIEKSPALMYTLYMYSSGVPGSQYLPPMFRDAYEFFFISFIGPAWANLRFLILLTITSALVGFGIDLWKWF